MNAPRTRLPWQPYPFNKGFIAYPYGEERKYHQAIVWPDSGLHSGEWRWEVRFGHPDPETSYWEGVGRHGAASSKQEAADRATEAWPEVEAEARAKGLIE